MKSKKNILVLLLIASILIMACGLSQSGAVDESPAVDVAEKSPEEPVEEAPPPTEEPAPMPEMDISELILTSADFPDVAFADVSAEEMGISVDDMNTEDFTVESFFTLLESENFEMVMGFTTLVQSILDKAGFDLILNQPDVLIDSFVGGMGDTGASEPQELPEFTDTVGDASAGLTLVANIEGIDMRIDTVVFRRDSIGSFVMIMYLDGQEPVVSLMDVATKFDERIIGFLATQ